MSPPDYGRSLRGLGVNLLVRETARTVDVRARRARAHDRLRRRRPGRAAPRRARVDGARRPHLRRAPAAAAHARRGAARRRHRAARARRGSRRRRGGRARAAASRCWSPPPTSRTACARPTSSTPTATSGSRICRRSASGTSRPRAARRRRPFSLLCAWAAIRSTSPTRAPRARTRRRPRAACTRLRARRRSRRSTSWPRRSSPARSTAACCRSRTRSPGSCRTRSRSSRRAPSRSWPRSPCTSRTAWSGPPGATLDTIRVVHSHPMALAQCRNALNGRYERVASSTTSEAARTVAALGDVTVAAIASPLAARSARPRDHRRGDLRPSREPHALRLAGALHAPRPRRPHRVAHRAPADHEARAGRAAQRDRAAALPRRADDLAALAADHGRALAVPVLHRRRRPPLGRARAARAQGRLRAQRRAARARLVSRQPRGAVSAVAAAVPRGWTAAASACSRSAI